MMMITSARPNGIVVRWILVPWPAVVCLSRSALHIPRSPVILQINTQFLPLNKGTLPVNPPIMAPKESPGVLEVATPHLRQSADRDPREATYSQDIRPEQGLPCQHQYQVPMEIPGET